MSGNSREKHTLKWEMHKKDEQMMDLQKALSDAHVFLYEERAQVLKLTAENDRLKSECEERNGTLFAPLPLFDFADLLLVVSLAVASPVPCAVQSRSLRIVSVWSIFSR